MVGRHHLYAVIFVKTAPETGYRLVGVQQHLCSYATKGADHLGCNRLDLTIDEGAACLDLNRLGISVIRGGGT